MGIKRECAIVLVLASFSLLHTACKKAVCLSPEQAYLSGGIAGYSPEVDSIKVGDTVWVESVIPHTLKTLNGANGTPTGDFLEFSNAENMLTDFHIISLVGVNAYNGAVDSFQFLTVKGQLSTNKGAPAAAKTVSFIEDNSAYRLKFAMVAKQKGIYAANMISIYQAKKNCTTASVSISRSNSDGHLHYLRDIYYGGGTVAALDSSNFCFMVY